MKRYIALKDMPNWGKGISVDANVNTGYIYLENFDRWIYDNELKFLLNYGWIKEVEEKEFTESDIRKAIASYESKVRTVMFNHSAISNDQITEVVISELRGTK